MSLQEFCKKYPEYCNQELFERVSGKAGGSGRQPASNFSRIYAKDVPGRVGSMVALEGVAMDVSNREYPRKDGNGSVKVTAFSLYDKTGRVTIKFLGDDFLDVSDMDILRVEGRVDEWRGGIEVRAMRVEKLGRVEVSEGELNEITAPPQAPDPSPQSQPKVDKKAESIGKVLSLLKSAKSQGRNVYYDKLEGLLSKLGLSFGDIEKFVEVKEVSVPGSLEKIKVVVLKDEAA